MQTIQTVLGADLPINEQLFPDLSKRALRKYLHGQDGIPTHNEALWECLVQSAQETNATEKYLTAACNCISVYLSSAGKSPVTSAQHFSFSKKTWFEAFGCAQRALDKGKTKPALQVLETLAQLLASNPSPDLASEILTLSSNSLLKALFSGESVHRVKSACIAITCLLKKTSLLLTFEDILEVTLQEVGDLWKQSQVQNGVSVGQRLAQSSQSSHLFLALLFAIQNLETRSAALKLFSNLIRAHKWTTQRAPARIAAAVIELFIEEKTDSLGDFADNVLPIVLDDREQFELFSSFYAPSSECSEQRLILYLSVLRIGRLKKYIAEDELPTILDTALLISSGLPSPTTDTYECFRILLRAGTSSIRIHTYNLLTASFGTAAALPAETLKCIIVCLRYVHDDNDAYERGEVLSISRRFLKRFESSFHILKKSARPVESAHVTDSFSSYENFVRDFERFLLEELKPGISYPRHILALQSLQLLVNVLEARYLLDFTSMIDSLLALVLDPFDDVRSTSFLILRGILESVEFRDLSKPKSLRLLQRMETLSMQTCRHDHCDATGRLWALFSSYLAQEEYEEAIQLPAVQTIIRRLHTFVQRCDSMTPGVNFPLHGLLHAVQYSMENTKEDKNMVHVQSDILNMCEKIWVLVQPRLCVDSPERATDDSAEIGFEGPKDLLAYSWRALRDSSLVLQAVLRTPHRGQEVLAQIGRLCMRQLASLRHRGAFSTVAQTFGLCCEKVRQTKDATKTTMIGTWYDDALRELEKQSKVLTRRSAGLPAMICALLGPNDDIFLSTVFQDLQSRAVPPHLNHQMDQGDVELPQVHALNCLKEIMTNSKFRASTDRYLPDMLDLAAESLSSQTWAIRNCGLMLLRACMNRIDQKDSEPPTESLEGSKNKRATKTTLQIAISLLDIDTTVANDPVMRSETIFAGLDLAKHVGPLSSNTSTLDELIYRQLGNPVWAIRDHAARLLASRTTSQDDTWSHNFVFGGHSPTESRSENMKHGTLLFIGYRFGRLRLIDAEKGTVVQTRAALSMMDRLMPRSQTGLSPYSKAALFDFMNDVLLHLSLSPTQEQLADIESRVGKLSADASPSYSASHHWRVLLYKTLMIFLQRQCDLGQNVAVETEIIDRLSQDPDAARFVIERLRTLGMAYSTPFAELLVGIMSACPMEDIQALAMNTLAEHSESHGNHFSDQQLHLLGAAIRFEHPYGRDILNAFIRLEGCLISQELSINKDELSTSLKCRLTSWLVTVKAASLDLLEFETRQNAGTALMHFCKQMVTITGHNSDSKIQHTWVKILLVTYDQLNDDDDEIRRIAEQTAGVVLQQWQPQLRVPVAKCAVAAREDILDCLVSRFPLEPSLSSLALRRVVGAVDNGSPEIDSLGEDIFQTNVQHRLDLIRTTMGDLFAEERQNLYIDELDEVQKWSTVLQSCCAGSRGPSDWYPAALDWCSHGLETILSLMQSVHTDGDAQRSNSTVFHPVGLTYHPDVLVLIVRVLKLARILIRLRRNPEGMTGNDEASKSRIIYLGQQMIDLKTACDKTKAHSRLLRELSVTQGSPQ